MNDKGSVSEAHLRSETETRYHLSGDDHLHRGRPARDQTSYHCCGTRYDQEPSTSPEVARLGHYRAGHCRADGDAGVGPYRET